MTPGWILPIYPLLLVGPIAGALAPKLPQQQAFGVLIAGVAFQGIGFLVSSLPPVHSLLNHVANINEGKDSIDDLLCLYIPPHDE
jgi:Voltage-dependent anion channel